MKKTKIPAILLALMTLTACARGAVIEGDTVSIAEADCKISFHHLSEIAYEDLSDYQKESFSNDGGRVFWQVEFNHSGDHDFSRLAFQPNLTFAPTSEITYFLTNGRSVEPIMGNVGLSGKLFATRGCPA